jgi:hypothetical protein
MMRHQDPKKAAPDVADYQSAISWASQTALRDAIGKTMLSDMLEGRENFCGEFEVIIDEWSILFCNIDYDRHLAIVAEMERNGKKSMIGVAGLIMNQDLTSGELAVLVQERRNTK